MLDSFCSSQGRKFTVEIRTKEKKTLKMSVDLTAESDLDTIFAEVGEFGIYQIAIYMLICIPNALSATFVVNYMFTANTLDYR